MPNIRPISDLRNFSNEISDFCKKTGEPVFITKNGVGDMVILSMDKYDELTMPKQKSKTKNGE